MDLVLILRARQIRGCLAIIKKFIGELPLEVRESAEVVMANAENGRDLRSGKTCMVYPEKILRTLADCVIT